MQSSNRICSNDIIKIFFESNFLNMHQLVYHIAICILCSYKDVVVPYINNQDIYYQNCYFHQAMIDYFNSFSNNSLQLSCNSRNNNSTDDSMILESLFCGYLLSSIKYSLQHSYM
jgi:hypothetical protein